MWHISNYSTAHKRLVVGDCFQLLPIASSLTQSRGNSTLSSFPLLTSFQPVMMILVVINSSSISLILVLQHQSGNCRDVSLNTNSKRLNDFDIICWTGILFRSLTAHGLHRLYLRRKRMGHCVFVLTIARSMRSLGRMLTLSLTLTRL